MRFRKERHAHGIEFSMTSMVDVISNVVIYFLIVQQFSQLEIADVHLPAADQAQDEPAPTPTRVIVNVDARGGLVVSGRAVTRERLTEMLRGERDRLRKVGREEDVNVVIRADGDAAYTHVQNLIADLAALDIWRVTFAVTRDGEEALP